MEHNQIYAGSPAKSISDKAGFQFNQISNNEKLKKLYHHLESWQGNGARIRLVQDASELNYTDGISYFDVSNRTYTKKGGSAEIDFTLCLLPEKAKFVPLDTI